MLPRERVFAALEHREPDRIPWGEHSIDYNVYEDILGRESYVQGKMKQTQAYWDGRRDEVVESHKRDKIDLVRALGMDIIAVGAVPAKDATFEPMEKTGDGAYRDRNGSIFHVSSTTHDLRIYKKNTKGYVPPTVEGLQEKIDALDEKAPGSPDETRWELVHHVVREMKDTHFVMLMAGDLGYPGFGATEEDFWMSLVLEPEICRKIAELRGRRMLSEVELHAALGVDGVMPCGDLGSSTGLMASPAIYRDMMYPWHKAHAEKARSLGLKVLKHCCGHTWPLIDEIAEIYDAYEGIQASAGMDIAKLKERVGDRLTLWGGIWHEHIVLGTTEDIRNDARYSFSKAAPGGGFIMGSTHSLAVGARRENILEMKRCLEDWGSYPIDEKRFASPVGSA